ncbi:hypothetical protein I8748_05415 [Nostoc sp. CENA67]|uniref:Uncharacterized protein n=1 Tax=Amazonocrinis nigriterrae CENA67 TaxID=2794033 RepID=A0A8J7L9M0_9NOST|nr:hypothetical protein [Amazonocrinis nigriterrae]MBH8561621.1 hypothetical protein [Amazonocrinis nigriterrae CENA67]
MNIGCGMAHLFLYIFSLGVFLWLFGRLSIKRDRPRLRRVDGVIWQRPK